MRPSLVSSAAPTLKPEKSATACSRAARAAATSLSTAALAEVDFSEAANDALEQTDELALHLLRGFHHFGVMQRFGKHARGGVGDARETEDLEAHVAGRDRLGHRRHPDGVGAQRAERANLRRRFVARTK